tara:strand:+ start:77 stop:304 length:228 start_codon:yes stop_codon:yes gene_type:complete
MKNELIVLINEAKKDIKEFKKNNPNIKINSFYELHDYFDANEYVKSLINEKGEFMVDEANLVLKELNNFIKQLNK